MALKEYGMAETFSKFLFVAVGAMFLASCASVERQSDSVREANLSQTPIGSHVVIVSRGGGVSTADLEVRNNSGSYIDSLYFEVHPYQGDVRVGMGNGFINSLNAGETIVQRVNVIDSGRPWRRWRLVTRQMR